MPNIRQYDAGNLALRPTEVGIDATAAAARRIGMFYNQLGAASETQARATGRVAQEVTGLGREEQQYGGEVAQLGAYRQAALTTVGRVAGSALEAAGGAAVSYIAHQEISHGATALSALMLKHTQDWNAIAKNADPNDPTVAQNYIQNRLDPDMEAFRGGFMTDLGQKWAQGHTDQFANHMVSKTTADMSQNAYNATFVNQRQLVNNLSRTVYEDPSPSTLDQMMAQLHSSIRAKIATSPNLDVSHASHLENELLQDGQGSLVKMAVAGAIKKDGKVPTWASDPKYAPYVTPQEITQFQHAAQYYDNLSKSQAESQRRTAEHDAKVDFNTKINALKDFTTPQNPGDSPTLPKDYWDRLRDLSNHPGAALLPGQLNSARTLGNTITAKLNKPEALRTVSHRTTMELLGQINRGELPDESRINDAFGPSEGYPNGRLTNADRNYLIKAFEEAKTPDGQSLGKERAEFFKKFAPIIDGQMQMTGVHSQLGAQRMYDFQMNARQQEAALRAKGLDPHLVYRPDQEYFWGNPGNIAQYHISMQDAQRYDKEQKNPPVAVPQVGARKEFKQGWGVWDGTRYVPEKAQ